MKTIFITGASAGLGKATARLFQERGWRVIATMRHPERETELSQLENVIILPLDVTDLEQIEVAVKKTTAIASVDVVFNNAGYSLLGPLEAYSDEQIVSLLETNLLGVIRVTKAFIPHFRKKRSGLFISTTSIGGLVSFPFSSMYHASKHAIEGWTASMACELLPFGIGMKTIAPGGINTECFNRSVIARMPEYKNEFEAYLSFPATNEIDEASTVAEVVYEAATDGKDKLRYVVGSYANSVYARSLKTDRDEFVRELGKSIYDRPEYSGERSKE